MTSPSASTRATDPPPAPISIMSITGARTGSPEPARSRLSRSTSNTWLTSGRPSSMRQTLAVVPPMSKASWSSRPELTGMGTTVSAMLLDGDRMVISHIGDSRIYLMRSGELSQISIDHTFVHGLVDAGRITAEEAMVHPRRSVLMRVLGDVESSPEIDSMVLDTRDGDRWMLCSDGLSGVVSFGELHELMSADAGAKQVADRLVKASLDGGAPDNVTVVDRRHRRSACTGPLPSWSARPPRRSRSARRRSRRAPAASASPVPAAPRAGDALRARLGPTTSTS